MAEQCGETLKAAPGAAKIGALEFKRETWTEGPKRGEIGLDQTGEPRSGKLWLAQGTQEKLGAFAKWLGRANVLDPRRGRPK
jgi:hypothetical protein